MGIFSGEKYSKETYKKAEEDLATIEENSRAIDNNKINKIVWKRKNVKKMDNISDNLWRLRNEAKERVEKLYGKGQTEAITLNKEYDRLLIKAQEAIKAVADFEREKLGMDKKNPDSPKEETEKKP